MSSDTVLFELTDQVAIITLNRPAVRNAMSRELGSALMEALQRVREEADIRAAVITGAGRTFCAGADLKERAQTGRAADASVASVIEASRTMGFARMVMEKPLIAAIDGYCLAAGFELALLCDIRICTPDAKFGLPEITRGFFPGGGGPQRLMRAIPPAVAMEMILTGDPIDAPTAQHVGLVSRLVPADALLATALQIAHRIAGHAPLAVRAVKEVAYAALDETLEQSLRFGGALRWIIGQTEDAREGPRAFAERREPRYQGR
ncbi:MAG TPA: enoyl-CoA hydratase-related protein [Candidatus Saccharimonadia bacterium]|nr:enoyl-CoA hydratase-related protein [Candidatus Saccharimonadia bacterium]